MARVYRMVKVFRTAEGDAKVGAERRCSSLRAAFGVLVKCASAVPRSVQTGGWSPFRDVYGCVVAKWLYAVATREPYSSPLVVPAGSKTLGSSASPASFYRPPGPN